MKNLWLEIPLADYEGQMALPEVAQTTLLADIFEGAPLGGKSFQVQTFAAVSPRDAGRSARRNLRNV